eukprot:3426580-Pleurochrysis_carterae.AAC.2
MSTDEPNCSPAVRDLVLACAAAGNARGSNAGSRHSSRREQVQQPAAARAHEGALACAHVRRESPTAQAICRAALRDGAQRSDAMTALRSQSPTVHLETTRKRRGATKQIWDCSRAREMSSTVYLHKRFTAASLLSHAM